jgi:hypothetical protein
MWRFTTYTGTVIEAQRYINKPMHWHERPVCHERRELWVSNGSGDQRKWVIHSKLMPARRDHQVTLLLVGPWVIGLFNATAHTSANYVREDPPFLLRGVDALVVLALMATACVLLGWLGLILALPGALAYLVGVAMFRAVHRWRMARVVDEALNELELMLVVRPMRHAGRQ